MSASSPVRDGSGEKEPLDELFTAVFELADKVASRISPYEVEMSLRRAVQEASGQLAADTGDDAALQDQLARREPERDGEERALPGTAEAQLVTAGAAAYRAAVVSDDPHRLYSTEPGSHGGSTVLRILLGTQLRRLRESRGINGQAAAKAIRGSESEIRRIELGRSAIREIDVLDLLTFYGVGPVEREQLLTVAQQASRAGWWHRFNDILPDWFQSYVGLEEAATSIRVYEPQFVPGLLQIPTYTAAVLAVCDIPLGEAGGHELLRKERQRRFLEGRLKLWAIIEETALRRPVGSKEILGDQLRHLLSLAGRPNFTLQIIPADMGSHAVPSGFTILRFAEPDLPDVAYLEHLTSALYFDKESEVDRYLMAMDHLSIVAAKMSETPEILAEIISELDAENYGLEQR